MESRSSDPDAAALQEAIDVIVRECDHPSDLAVRYSSADGTKTTEIRLPAEKRTIEVVYDGADDAEPSVSSRPV